MLDSSSDSEPSFDSPSEDDDFDVDDEDDASEDDLSVAPPPSKSFHGPIVNESQNDSGLDSPLGLATQPTTLAISAAKEATKKRKVSLSPTDSLAHVPPRRKSPRSSPRSGVIKGSVEVVNLLDEDENPARIEKVVKKSKSQSGSKSTKRDVSTTTSSQAMGKDQGNQQRDLLKTNLFPADKDQGKAPAPRGGEPSKAPAKDEVSTKHASEKNLSNKKAAKESTTKRKSPPKKVAATAKKYLSAAETKAAVKKKAAADSTTTKAAKLSVSTEINAGEDNKNTTTTKASKPPPVAAPSKAKKKKKSFQDKLLHLMFMTCKPYTVKSLLQEMKEISESAIEFCFLSLVDKGWVTKKEFASKSRTKELYWANQECKNKELMEILDMVPSEQIHQAREELQRLKQQDAQITRELAIVMQEPSNLDLNSQVAQYEAQVKELERRLGETHDRIRGPVQAKAAPPMGRPGFGKKAPKPLSSKSLKKKINDMRLHWKKRKEKCSDFIDCLADGMEKKPKEVIKLLDLETDEMVGVVMPPKHTDI